MIQVWQRGTKVTLHDDLVGTVLSVSIRGTSIQYEVAWWDGRTRKVEWFAEFELAATGDEEKTAIGFR